MAAVCSGISLFMSALKGKVSETQESLSMHRTLGGLLEAFIWLLNTSYFFANCTAMRTVYTEGTCTFKIQIPRYDRSCIESFYRVSLRCGEMAQIARNFFLTI